MGVEGKRCCCQAPVLDKKTKPCVEPEKSLFTYNIKVCTAAVGSLLSISSDPEFLVFLFFLLVSGAIASTIRGISLTVLHSFLFICIASLASYYHHRHCLREAVKKPPRTRKKTKLRQSISQAQRKALEVEELLHIILSFLSLRERAILAMVSRATHSAVLSPKLWRATVVPDLIDSINSAVKSIPRSLYDLHPNFLPRILVRPGVYWEGGPRGLLVLFRRRPSGIYVDRKVSIERYHDPKHPHRAADKMVRIHSNAGEAVTIAHGADGSRLQEICVGIDRFSSHGVAVYADGVELKECKVSAKGTNACGVLIGERSEKVSMRNCEVSHCGGSGVLLAYNAGPLTIVDCK
eukprot:1376890-Amorphochlora_amoeboformis.AAC.1